MKFQVWMLIIYRQRVGKNKYLEVVFIELLDYGNAVQTAYHLTVLFPLTLFYFFNTKSIKKYIPLMLIIISFLLLQTRASIVIVMFLIIIMIFNSFLKIKFKDIKLIFYFISIFLTVLFFNENLLNFILDFFEEIFLAITFDNSVVGKDSVDLINKVSRIPIAFNLFLDNPFFGMIVSPRFVYYDNEY